MGKSILLILLGCFWCCSIAFAEEQPKIAVWDLQAANIPASYAELLTSNLISEIAKNKKYEVISQENIRTVAGWTDQRMMLGCTDTKCLIALGQMNISKLISGRVGKIGNTYVITLHLFDTQNVRAENSISEDCRIEDELIPLIRQAGHKLLGEVDANLNLSAKPSPVGIEKAKDKATAIIEIQNKVWRLVSNMVLIYSLHDNILSVGYIGSKSDHRRYPKTTMVLRGKPSFIKIEPGDYIIKFYIDYGSEKEDPLDVFISVSDGDQIRMEFDHSMGWNQEKLILEIYKNGGRIYSNWN